jgi:hypothetical protein
LGYKFRDLVGGRKGLDFRRVESDLRPDIFDRDSVLKVWSDRLSEQVASVSDLDSGLEFLELFLEFLGTLFGLRLELVPLCFELLRFGLKSFDPGLSVFELT